MKKNRRFLKFSQVLNINHENDQEIDLSFKKNRHHQYQFKNKAKKTVDFLNSGYYPNFYGIDDDEISSGSEEEYEHLPKRLQQSSSDLPSEYWQIQKMIKYMKCGNQTATVIILCALKEYRLATVEINQMALYDIGGVDLLVNILDTDEPKCKIGSLSILSDVSSNPLIRRTISDLGALPVMLDILDEPNSDLKILAAQTIANVAKFRKARRTIRNYGGIRKLVALLDCRMTKSKRRLTEEEEKKKFEIIRSGVLALWSCCRNTKSKFIMRKCGIIPILTELLKSSDENLLIPVIGTLQECASESSYRLAIRSEGMIIDLIKNLKSTNVELQTHCATTIFKCTVDKETRNIIRQHNGLKILISLLEKGREHIHLLIAITGAIWKCSYTLANIVEFHKFKTINILSNFLNDQPDEVLTNVVGALAELANNREKRILLRTTGALNVLIELLSSTNKDLLVNVNRAMAQCAEEPSNMELIDKLDGIRLIWSLLRHKSPVVQTSAAWAICPCIENAFDAGDLVRSFVGGLELIVQLLNSTSDDVLAAVCAAISRIAIDDENVAVLTDHGVIPMLAQITNRVSGNMDVLKQHLADAIANCCKWHNNREEFGYAKVVVTLVKNLRSKNINVHRSTSKALYELSKHPKNCIIMHENGAVKLLIPMIGSADSILQEAAAGCIGNLRRLALANELARQYKSKKLRL